MPYVYNKYQEKKWQITLLHRQIFCEVSIREIKAFFIWTQFSDKMLHYNIRCMGNIPKFIVDAYYLIIYAAYQSNFHYASSVVPSKSILILLRSSWIFMKLKLKLIWHYLRSQTMHVTTSKENHHIFLKYWPNEKCIVAIKCVLLDTMLVHQGVQD